ncbi:MAG: MBL fold metallo-hydrolase [Clostridia bacterium]|nr:MBL fold metallo-hydrolase [Clostridia bacterium]
MLKFCSLSSSSSGNCLYVTDGSSSILIDCGLSFTKTSSLLNLIGVNISDIDAVLVTHEHTDHTSGLGVLLRKQEFPYTDLRKPLLMFYISIPI